MVELIHILHHRHAPLLQVQELHQFPIQRTSRNVVLSKSNGKLLPSHTVIHQLHGIEGVPIVVALQSAPFAPQLQ